VEIAEAGLCAASAISFAGCARGPRATCGSRRKAAVQNRSSARQTRGWQMGEAQPARSKSFSRLDEQYGRGAELLELVDCSL